ncbi:MAG TPA: hypothetical protein VNJ53_12645 [Gaiellaceae bacterium]|nr:hypothetical protein [Gaiellaceae bacterium]
MKEIARLLGVSQSSASLWVRDVRLTPGQRRALDERAQEERNRSRRAHFRDERRGYQAHGRRLAQRGDAVHAAGTTLYWAEGEKGSRNVARLTNSDPELVRFFVRFLRAFYDVRDEQIRITCHLFAGHLERQREIERFWLETLELPASCLVHLGRERVLEVQPEEADEQAAVRDRAPLCSLDRGRPEHLRRDPGVRRLRAPSVARVTHGGAE